MGFVVVSTENDVFHHETPFDTEDDAREYLAEVSQQIHELLTFNEIVGHETTEVRVEHAENGSLDAVEFDSINHPGVVVRYQVKQND